MQIVYEEIGSDDYIFATLAFMASNVAFFTRSVFGGILIQFDSQFKSEDRCPSGG